MIFDKARFRTYVPWLVPVALALAGAAMTFVLSGALPPELRLPAHWDLYFDSDIPRTFIWGTWIPWSRLVGIPKHPLLGWVISPFFLLFRSMFGTDDWTSMRWVFVLNSFVWTVLFYRLASSLCKGLWAGVCLTLLALSSASAIFFLPAPDVFAPGSTSILAAFALMNVRSKRFGEVRSFLAQLLTAAITVTNLSAGIVVSFAGLRFRRALAVSFGFFILTVLAVLFFSGGGNSADASWQPPSFKRDVLGEFEQYRNWRPLLKKPFDFFLVPISPRGLIYNYFPKSDKLPKGYEILSTMDWGKDLIRNIDPPSSSIQLLGYVLWIGLLAGGIYYSVRDTEHRPMILALLGSIAIQMGIHAFYGYETFLYSLHWLPLCVLLIAGVMRSNRSKWAVAAVLLLVAINLRTNLPMFYDGTRMIRSAIDGRVKGLVPSPD